MFAVIIFTMVAVPAYFYFFVLEKLSLTKEVKDKIAIKYNYVNWAGLVYGIFLVIIGPSIDARAATYDEYYVKCVVYAYHHFVSAFLAIYILEKFIKSNEYKVNLTIG